MRRKHNHNKENINVKFIPEIYAKIKKEAKELGIGFSEMLEIILREGLTGCGTPQKKEDASAIMSKNNNFGCTPTALVGAVHLRGAGCGTPNLVSLLNPKLVQRTTTTVDTNKGTRVEVIEEFERA